MSLQVTDRQVQQFRSVPRRLNLVERRVENMGNTLAKRDKALKKVVATRMPRVWTKRNIIVSAVSWLGGAGTAWLLHEKLPHLNVVAGASGAMLIAEEFGLEGKRHGMIIGAIGGMGTKVLQKEVPVASLILPTVGISDFYTTLLDNGIDAYGEWRDKYGKKNRKPSGKKKNKSRRPSNGQGGR